MQIKANVIMDYFLYSLQKKYSLTTHAHLIWFLIILMN